MRTASPVLALLVAGCTADLEPTWAFDPMYLQVDGVEMSGFQAWEVYGPRWEERQRSRDYVCAVVVSLTGEPAEPAGCPGCEAVWSVSAEVVDSDCPSSLAERAPFTSIRRIGVGSVAPELIEDDPHRGQSRGGYVDYGEVDWEPHGWAWPSQVDQGARPTPWDGQEPLTLWPAFAWQL